MQHTVTQVTYNNGRRVPRKSITLRLRGSNSAEHERRRTIRRNNNNALRNNNALNTRNKLGKKLNNTYKPYNATNPADQEAMAETYLKPVVDMEDHNYGHLQVEQAQRRAAFYLPRLIAYVKPIDKDVTVPQDDIFGLIIHYPDQRPMAFDFTTTFQYDIFPAIQATTTNENQPIMLITKSGFQEIDADDIRGKYADALTTLFAHSSE